MERERDLSIGIAQEALDMVLDNGETVITFRAILGLISPKRQDDRQDDIPKDAQNAKQGAAKARRMAKTREAAMLRKALGWAWKYAFVLENVFKYKIRDDPIRKADANARIT